MQFCTGETWPCETPGESCVLLGSVVLALVACSPASCCLSAMVAQLMGSLFQGSFTSPALPAFSLGGVAASVVDGQFSSLGFARPRPHSPLNTLHAPRCQGQG